MTKAGALALFENSAQSEILIVRTAVLLSNHGVLSVIMAGLILAGILASTMSTSDSQLLAASSCVSQNLFCDCMGLKLSKKIASMLMAKTYSCCDRHYRCFHCQEPKQFCIPHRIFRLGRIWCDFRCCHAVFIILETYQSKWCTCRNDCRWRYGIYMEISDCPTWRPVWNL